MWFTKANRVWEKLPDDEIIRRLTPREGKIDMVLDTDTFNEVDDQFALAYCMLSPERLNVQAVYAAPFYNDRATGPEDGMEKSYGEIVRLLGKMRRAPDGLVLQGQRRAYLPEARTPVDSRRRAGSGRPRHGARRRPTRSMSAAIGAITNVASAHPHRAGASPARSSLVWLGGRPAALPLRPTEFDLRAGRTRRARAVLDSGVPIVLDALPGRRPRICWPPCRSCTTCIGGAKRAVRRACRAFRRV